MSDEVMKMMKMMVQQQAEMRAQMVKMETRMEARMEAMAKEHGAMARAMAKELAEVHACTVTVSATSTTHTGGAVPMSAGHGGRGVLGGGERGGGASENKSAHEPSEVVTGAATGIANLEISAAPNLRPLQGPSGARPAAGSRAMRR